MGVQVGEGNTQIIYSYNRLTWTDGVAPPPLADVSGVVDSPYRGLSAFEERDAAFFFGREVAATRVLERLSRELAGTGLLVVSGVSGAGKSSLLRAGVLPRLRGAGLASAPGSGSWPCLLFIPARAPLDELAVRVASLAGADAAAVRRELDTDPAGFALTARQAALAPPGGLVRDTVGSAAGQARRRLLLVVDQFEQLFTQCPDEEQRRAFIIALHAAATAAHGPDQDPAALVVLGVRADFEGRCADYAQLADAVQERYLVTAMTKRQLRLAITEPAKKAGSSVEDDLADVLLDEVRTRNWAVSGAGVLPLLSHALDQAWRSRTGRVLSLTDYERTGGIEGAVADSAERAYDRLTPAQQAAARQVFTRLTATSSDGVDTADRAGRVELTEGKGPAEARDVEAVLEAFAAERLLTLAAGTVEISHEILLTAWPLLRDTWLAETHADRIVRTRMHNVAAEWTGSRDQSYLYTGSLLVAATETATRIGADQARHPSLSQTERDFLHASSRLQRRKARRRRGLIAFLMVLVVGFASVAVLALRATQEAVHQRDIAISSQLIGQSERLGDSDPAVSKLESIAAWRINPSSEARYAMLTAAARPGIAALPGHTGIVFSVAFSPDGTTLASGGADGTVRLWDVATRRQIGRPHTRHTRAVHSVAFSPDGTTLASGSADGTVRLWNVATGRQIGEPLTGTSGDIESVAFSPDGTTLAVGSADGTVRLWDVATGRQIGEPLTFPRAVIESVAFSLDGTTLAIGSTDARGDGTVWLWDVATGQQLGEPLTGHLRWVYSLAFSPDGKTLASGGADVQGNGVVQRWDVTTGHPSGKLLTGPAGIVYSVAFSPDGMTMAGASDDGTVRLWDMATGRQIGPPLTGSAGAVYSVAFSPDGTTLASGGADGTVRLWDMGTDHQIGAPLTGHTGAIYSVAFSSDDKTLASGTGDGPVRLWNVATGRQIGNPLTGHTNGVASVAFSPDGKTLASGSLDHTVRLWNVATHRLIGKPLTGHTGPVNSVAFSPNGKALVTGGSDHTVRMWNLATHRLIGKPLTGHTGPVTAVAFSPDGKTLASGSVDGTVRLWDVATGRQIGNPLTGSGRAVDAVAFILHGKALASGGDDGTVRLWDVATGRQIGNPLTGSNGPVYAVVFSPDGKTLATGSEDGTVRLWDVAYLVNVVPYLCATLERTFTRAEWARYIPRGPAYQNVCP
jgi:WD40 repeat protein